MIWHIFKKDCRLLWPLVTIVAIAHAISAILWIVLGRFEEPRQLELIANLFPLVGILGIVILTVTVVHQDGLPGTRQDWLVRPIKRVDLLFAKLLFLIVMVHGPLWAADFTEALWQGFSVQASLVAALSKGLEILCLVSLPAMALGAVTQNMTQALFGALAAVMGCMATVLIVQAVHGAPSPIAGSGLVWIGFLGWIILGLIGAVLVLLLQYARRRTAYARALMVGISFVVLSTLYLPWKPAFALQQWVAPHPGASQGVALSFDPHLQRMGMAPRLSAGAIYLPLRIEGLPADSILMTDRAEIHLSDTDGNMLYRGTSNLSVDGKGSMPEARMEVRQDPHKSDVVQTYQTVFLPAEVYSRAKDQSVRLTVNYSLTLFKARPTQSIRALAGDRRIPKVGWCGTKPDDDEDGIVLKCLYTEPAPSCVTAFLEHIPTGRRNPESHACQPWYWPYTANVWPDVLTHFSGEFPFRDPSGLAQYPVGSADLAQSRIVLKSYEAQDHFTRRLVIPRIRLVDLRPIKNQ